MNPGFLICGLVLVAAGTLGLIFRVPRHRSRDIAAADRRAGTPYRTAILIIPWIGCVISGAWLIFRSHSG